MKKKIFFILFVLCLSCSIDENNFKPTSDSAFSIYFFEDATIKIEQAFLINLSTVKLMDEPWLSGDDIDYYDFSSHCIYLKDDKSGFFQNLEDGSFPAELKDKPFIVASDGLRRYLGSFHSGITSTEWQVPYIEDIYLDDYPEDVIPITWIWLFWQGPDNRYDRVIKNALIRENKYHAGLSISLDSLTLIENSDTTTISYSFTITNNDENNLYTIDPDLMGSELFHHYNKGAVLFNITNNVVYRAENKVTESPESPRNSFTRDPLQ